jgi:hypothetical protein
MERNLVCIFYYFFLVCFLFFFDGSERCSNNRSRSSEFISMILTREEFKLIRPISWTMKIINDIKYNTPIDSLNASIFWYDFMKYVFAPRFHSQTGVSKLQDFDIMEQPVLLTDDLDLKLPEQMETVGRITDPMLWSQLDAVERWTILPFNTSQVMYIVSFCFFVFFLIIMFFDLDIRII